MLMDDHDDKEWMLMDDHDDKEWVLMVIVVMMIWVNGC